MNKKKKKKQSKHYKPGFKKNVRFFSAGSNTTQTKVLKLPPTLPFGPKTKGRGKNQKG